MSSNCCNLTLGVEDNPHINMAISGANYNQPYELPTMSTTVKGGAKVGEGLAIDENEQLSIEDGAITAAKLDNGAVTTDKLADGAVTLAKVDSSVADLFAGNVKAFDTVAAMQSADLQAGDICHTNGFHSAGDGGAAFYKISASGTANGMDVLACGDVFATIVGENSMTVEQFGATEINDIGAIINRALLYANEIVLTRQNYTLNTTIELQTRKTLISYSRSNVNLGTHDESVTSMVHIEGHRIVIEGIQFLGVDQTIECIQGAAYYSVFRNIEIRQFTNGIRLSGSSSSKVENLFTGLQITQCSNSALITESSGYTDACVSDCWFATNHADAQTVKLNNSGGWQFNNVHFYGVPVPNRALDLGQCSSCSLNNVYIEGFSTYAIVASLNGDLNANNVKVAIRENISSSAYVFYTYGRNNYSGTGVRVFNITNVSIDASIDVPSSVYLFRNERAFVNCNNLTLKSSPQTSDKFVNVTNRLAYNRDCFYLNGLNTVNLYANSSGVCTLNCYLPIWFNERDTSNNYLGIEYILEGTNVNNMTTPVIGHLLILVKCFNGAYSLAYKTDISEITDVQFGTIAYPSALNDNYRANIPITITFSSGDLRGFASKRISGI